MKNVPITIIESTKNSITFVTKYREMFAKEKPVTIEFKEEHMKILLKVMVVDHWWNLLYKEARLKVKKDGTLCAIGNMDKNWMFVITDQSTFYLTKVLM